jgi:hypothetical protein
VNDVGTGESSESSKPVMAVDPIEVPGEPLGFKVSDSGKKLHQFELQSTFL